MVKLRNWFIHLFIVFLTAIVAIHLVWTYSPIKDQIKEKIITSLRPYLGESFLLRDFSLGFGYISFQRVTTTNEAHTFDLNLQEVRIGFNMLKLLWYEFEPLKSIETVTLQNPQLVIYQAPNGKREPQADNASAEDALAKIMMNVQRIPNIDRIHVSDADILWELEGGKRIPILEALEGYLVNSSQNEVDFDLVGRFHGSAHSAISLNGTLDILDENVSAWLIMDNCQISSDFPFLSNGFYVFEHARLSGEIFLFSNSFLLDSLRTDGNILAQDFAVSVFNQQAVADTVRMEFTGRTLKFQKFRGVVEGGEFEFEGIVENIIRPQIHWYLDVKNFPAQYMKNSHDIFEHVLEGQVDAQAEFHGPVKDITITARANAARVQYAVVPFTNVEAELTYANHLLEFSRVRADFKQFRTMGSGKIDFDQDYLRLLLKSDLMIPEDAFDGVDKLNEAQFILNTDFSGDISTKQFFGNFDYTFTNGEEILFNGTGPYTLDNEFLYFTLSSADLADTVLVAGAVDSLFSHPTFKILSVRNFPVSQCTSSPVIADIADDYRLNLFVEGPYDFLQGRMNVLSKQQSDRTVFTLAGSLKEVFSESQYFKGNFSAQTSPIKLGGEMEISLEENGFRTEISVSDFVSGNLFVGLSEDAPIKGKLYINRFSVADYFSGNSESAQDLIQGFLQGEVVVSGTVQKPHLQFNLTADEFIINDVGYYSTQVSGTLQDHLLSFEDFWVRLNNNPVFNANFRWNVREDSLDLEIVGENIESNFLAETIFKNKNIIRGSFSYTLKATGSPKHPRISGNVEVKDGTLHKNAFKAFHITFEDSIPPGAQLMDLDEHIIKLKNLIYIDRKDYTVTANGLIGVGKDGVLDLTAKATGNILAEIPQISSFFQNPKSVGELHLILDGSRTNPLIAKAQLSVFDGSMTFESVIPPLKELQIEMDLDEEDNFVQIKKIEGKIGSQLVRIYNVREAYADSEKLSPWYFEDLELDFGVLVLETEGRGIPLSIPGLMEEEDIGYFGVSGREEGEKFYFAGPVEEPYARGTVILSNSRVTFPFIGMEEETDEVNPVIEFLMNTEWDVHARSREGNRYFVEIPAYVGKAMMDLNIDNVSPGLTFTGRLVDESFRVEGSVQSSRGRVEYLDINFKVEKFGAEFTRFELYPTVYGAAYTTVRDSTGEFSRDIYLVLYAIDPETGQEISQGRWEDFRFKLVSSDPVIGETQEQVLAYLGYSVQNIPGKASEVGLTMTENLLIRPLVRPLEKQMEKELGLDYVRLRSRLTSNLFYLSMQNQDLTFLQHPLFYTTYLNNDINPALLLFQSSEITLGKYLARDLYLTYTGQLLSGYEETNVEEAKLGFYHRFGLEYRLLRNLLLEIEYDNFQLNTYYYNRADLNDFRIRLRHSFHF